MEQSSYTKAIICIFIVFSKKVEVLVQCEGEQLFEGELDLVSQSIAQYSCSVLLCPAHLFVHYEAFRPQMVISMQDCE